MIILLFAAAVVSFVPLVFGRNLEGYKAFPKQLKEKRIRQICGKIDQRKISLELNNLTLANPCGSEDYYYYSFNSNISRSTPMGIAAYRSALTLDWIAAEDHRQRELAAAFETEDTPVRVISSDCIGYPKPTSGKIGRLMLELLKNLEGDEGTLVSELMQVLVRYKFLVESSIFDSEPDLDSLVKTPDVMMGEPHTTFPRILAIIWMLVTDPVTTNKYGWCPIKKVSKYLSSERSSEVAKQMRALEIVIVRARFIMEEFIQTITPTNMYQKTTLGSKKIRHRSSDTKKHGKKHAQDIAAFPTYTEKKATLEPEIQEIMERQKYEDRSHILITSRSNALKSLSTIIFAVLFV